MQPQADQYQQQGETYGGTFLRRSLGNAQGVRVFNRSMAALLVASVGYLLMA